MALKNRAEKLGDALDRLNEDVELMHETNYGRFYVQCRNSTIKSFEFTIDLFWKYLKDVLHERFAIELASPKPIFKSCQENQLISQEEYRKLIKAIEDRNETSHCYDEAMAEQILKNVTQEHCDLMGTIFKRLTKE